MVTTLENSAGGRLARLYYEACIPASLMIVAAWNYGVHKGGRSWATSAVAIALSIYSLWIQRPRKFSGISPWLEGRIRPGADDGAVWGILLVPLVLFAKSADDNFKYEWLISISLSMSLLLSLVARTVYRIWKPVLLFLTLWISGSVILAHGMNTFGGSLFMSTVLFMLASLMAVLNIDSIIKLLPGSLSFGEAAVGAQSLILVAMDLGARTFTRGSSTESICLEAAVVGLALLALSLSFAFRYRRRMGKYIEPAVFGGLSLLLIWLVLALVKFATKKSPVAWVLSTVVLGSTTNIVLLGYWAVILSFAALFYKCAGPDSEAANKFWLHVRRKSYHGLATLLFAPGILYARQLLHLGFTVALACFVLAECLRALHIHPWSSVIDQFLRRFTDHRDAGAIVTSHFFLLFGCALPVWLGGSSAVACLAGVLTLGIADTAASLVGTRFGRHRWPGSPKTVEGSAAFAASLCAAAGIAYAAGADEKCGPIGLLVLCAVLAALEALTTQNDNLVVPLTMYAAMHVALGSGSWHTGSALLVALAWAAPSLFQGRNWRLSKKRGSMLSG
ncbi:dolichol kinase [Coemansia interrupta]|uniref:dolichol kinase n=1 Tax=Coemansia interrupta TaxID=1126814 RepID=A0A9W8LDX9_9FUNG|nr:dolichol kinase [Coemansia interrupta]